MFRVPPLATAPWRFFGRDRTGGIAFPADAVFKNVSRPSWDVSRSTAGYRTLAVRRDCTGGIAFPADAVSKNASHPSGDVSRSFAGYRLRRFGHDRISASLPRALFPKRALPGWDASRSTAGRRTLLALFQVWPHFGGSGVTARVMCSLCARRLRKRALSLATGATNRRLPCPDGSLGITAQAMLHSPARRFQKRATHR